MRIQRSMATAAGALIALATTAPVTAAEVSTSICVKRWSVRDLNPLDKIKAAVRGLTTELYDGDAQFSFEGGEVKSQSLGSIFGHSARAWSTSATPDMFLVQYATASPGYRPSSPWLELAPFTEYSFEAVARISGRSTAGTTVGSVSSMTLYQGQWMDLGGLVLAPTETLGSLSLILRNVEGSYDVSRSTTFTATNNTSSVMYVQTQWFQSFDIASKPGGL